MTNDDTMLREVDQALAEDKTSEQIKKNLPAIIAAALVVVGGVGGWQFWSARKTAKATADSAAYSAAGEAGSDEAVHAALEKLGGESGGYAALAKLRLAGEAAAHGEREKALGLYREVYGAGTGSRRLKDVARLRAGYLALADGRDAVLKDVGDLETDETAIGHHAREIIALAALGAGDYQAAEQMFRKAASDAKAPEGVKLRAGEFAALASAGKAGVKLPSVAESQKSTDEIYLENLDKAGADLSAVVDGPAESAADGATPPADPAAENAPEGNE